MDVNRLYVYGILKRGKILDLEKEGCKFLGEATIPDARLYRISSGVGLRLNEDPLQVEAADAHGDVFEIPKDMWEWLDGLETNGVVYTRKVVDVAMQHDGGISEVIPAYVYEHMMWPAQYYRENLQVIETGVY